MSDTISETLYKMKKTLQTSTNNCTVLLRVHVFQVCNFSQHCIAKERPTPWQLISIMILFLNVPSASATQSVVLIKNVNYTVFQNDTPAMFCCYGSGYENEAVVAWILNGTGYGSKHAQRVVTDPPTGDTVSSRLFIPSNSTIHNGTEVKCKTVDSILNIVLISEQANLTLQGPLDAPSNFSVNISNTSNTTFLLSWGAPFSLDVTDSPDIFYYTLCANITVYGCKNISSDPDCTFPRTCTSSVDFTHHSLNGTNGGQNKTIMDYGDPIHFTFFAVNGAGNGTKANLTYFIKKESGENLAPSQTEPKSTNIVPTTTTLSSNCKIPVAVGVCILIVVILIIVLLAIMRCGTKRTSSEPPVDVELYSATHQEKTTVAANNLKKTSESHYIDVACHPVTSIPAPHHNVQYRKVKPQNEKAKPDPKGCIDVVCHPVISIPAPHHVVQYSEAIQNPHRVECDSEDNGNESDSRWCQHSDPAQQATTVHIAPGIDLAATYEECKSTQQILSEPTEQNWTCYSDLSDIKSFTQEPYNSCEGTDDISPFFAFASTITPQCTKLSPTVLVHE